MEVVVIDSAFKKTSNHHALLMFEKIVIISIKKYLQNDCGHFVTSLREDVVLFEFNTLRPRVLIVHAHDQIAVEEIKLLTTVPSDGPTQSPYNCEQKEALQPHGYLLAGHIPCAIGS